MRLGVYALCMKAKRNTSAKHVFSLLRSPMETALLCGKKPSYILRILRTLGIPKTPVEMQSRPAMW